MTCNMAEMMRDGLPHHVLTHLEICVSGIWWFVLMHEKPYLLVSSLITFQSRGNIVSFIRLRNTQKIFSRNCYKMDRQDTKRDIKRQIYMRKRHKNSQMLSNIESEFYSFRWVNINLFLYLVKTQVKSETFIKSKLDNANNSQVS